MTNNTIQLFNEQITIRIPSQLKERLSAVAASNATTCASFMRTAIAQRVRQEEMLIRKESQE